MAAKKCHQRGGRGPTPKSHEKFPPSFFGTLPLGFRKRNYPLVLIDAVCQPHFIWVGTYRAGRFPCQMFFDISYWYFSWNKFSNPDIKSQLSKAINQDGVALNLQMLLHMEKSNIYLQGNIPKQQKRNITFAIRPMTNFGYFVANLCTVWCTFYSLNSMAVC